MTDEELLKKLKHPATFGAFMAGDEKNFVVAATPGGIEAQEAAGQEMLVESQWLPKEGTIAGRHFGSGEVYRPKLEALGFVFGKEVDNLFVECQLPPGWKKEPTGHSMWSSLKDAKGRERANIFYKAAFYDRSAHFSPSHRFIPRTWYAPSPEEPEAEYAGADTIVCDVVMDIDQPIFATTSYRHYDFETSDARRKEQRAWLDAHYPNWEDPFAYWEE